MSDLMADAEDPLQKLSDTASPEIRELRGRVQESVAQMKTHLRSRLKAGVGDLENLTDQAIEFVQEYPWVAVAAATAVAAALVAGLVVAAGERR